ncbi:hypothetical protein SprV_0100059000 [Sparganum proliferum]
MSDFCQIRESYENAEKELAAIQETLTQRELQELLGGKEWTFQRNGRYSLIGLQEPGDSSSSKYCNYVAIFNKCNELRSKLLVVHKKLKTEAQVYLESQADRHRSIHESRPHVCANEYTGPRDDSLLDLPLKDCFSAFEDFDGVRVRVQVQCRVKTALAEASTAQNPAAAAAAASSNKQQPLQQMTQESGPAEFSACGAAWVQEAKDDAFLLVIRDAYFH